MAQNKTLKDMFKEDCLQGSALGAVAYDAEKAQCETTSSQSWMRTRFFETIFQIFHDSEELIKIKNSDYTKLAKENPFHNFKDEEIQAFLSQTNIRETDAIILNLLFRLGEKRKRLMNVLLTGQFLVLSETLEDTLKDLINYHAILLAYLKMNGRLEQKPYVPSELEQKLMAENRYLQDELKEKKARIGELLENRNDSNNVKKDVPKLTKLKK